MAEGIVDINQVPEDVDSLKIGVILNPTTEEFVHKYAGKDIVVPAGTVEAGSIDGKRKSSFIPGRVQYPLPVCIHIAKHLAERIVRKEEKDRIDAIKDDKLRDEESRKAFPNYKARIFDKMKEIVETDSDFFSDEKKDAYTK